MGDICHKAEDIRIFILIFVTQFDIPTELVSQ
jgi:hypothetical protein